jgi:hypothetical protein
LFIIWNSKYWKTQYFRNWMFPSSGKGVDIQLVPVIEVTLSKGPYIDDEVQLNSKF